MPNNYFKFKQFTVEQGLADMKVGTDGVLLGAWADIKNKSSVLDVGTGTGLIALMLAQRNTQAYIDAIEINEKSYRQALVNVHNCKWQQRINIIHIAFQEYIKACSKTYDLIISNPPYFNNSLKPQDGGRATARHSDTLSYDELIQGSRKLLNDSGKLSVILPYNESFTFEELAAKNGLYCCRKLNIKPVPQKPVIRIAMEFNVKPSEREEQTISIETGERHIYTKEYKDLTKDFYLKF